MYNANQILLKQYMTGNEFDKILLELDGVFNSGDKMFGPEWEGVRKQQIGFLLERPLMLKVLSEKVWGPSRIHVYWTEEWKETERAISELTKSQGAEELADMTILSLTLDSLNQQLILPPQIRLLESASGQIANGLHKRLGLDMTSLIPVAEKKIKLNEIRNPPEAFVLVSHEGMEQSKQRLDHNWSVLKQARNSMPKLLNNPGWWKKQLFVDESGWMREIDTT